MRLPLPFLSAFFLAVALRAAPVQPAPGPILPLDGVKAGQRGEVWTVFKGTEPEPFEVEVTGVVLNALGPGKSIILCRLTDPRVKDMGAVAGMSGSPLYIEGRLAGALSYQIQQFETVHYAGFTPAADLAEVGDRVEGGPVVASAAAPAQFEPLRPVFNLSGLSPAAAGIMSPYFAALGVNVTALGGSLAAPAQEAGAEAPTPLRAGDAVSVALATGDITLAGTGTVSRVDGDRVIAFGHPMMSLGDSAFPLCSAEIVGIIPSELQSIKIANTGPVIGVITQDRLSAVSGRLGPGPAMIDVDVTAAPAGGPARRLRFRVIRNGQLSPVVVATGVTQAVTGANDSGFSNGFRIRSAIRYPGSRTLASDALYAGPQAFALGMAEFVKGLSQDLQNPYEKTFPERVEFSVEPLAENPVLTLNRFALSRPEAKAGQVVRAALDWRDYQGAEHHDSVDIPLDPAWTGKSLEVVLAPGPALDVLTGRPVILATSQLRSFDAYLDAMRDVRSNDGVYVAVVEASELFSDQMGSTPDLPDSLARVASAADETRFRRHPAVIPLWERHLLPGKLDTLVVRRALRVIP